MPDKAGRAVLRSFVRYNAEGTLVTLLIISLMITLLDFAVKYLTCFFYNIFPPFFLLLAIAPRKSNLYDNSLTNFQQSHLEVHYMPI